MIAASCTLVFRDNGMMDLSPAVGVGGEFQIYSVGQVRRIHQITLLLLS